MDKTQEFLVGNFKNIAVALGFVIGLYIQHQANTAKIESLQMEVDRLDTKLEAQYGKLDNIKLDKTVFEATVKQLSSMAQDIREIRNNLEQAKLQYK